MGQAYSGFAAVYDLFMDNVPYDKWCSFLLEKMKQYGYEPGMTIDAAAYDLKALGVDTSDPDYATNITQEHNTVLDLGCGTGKMTRALAKAGFDMIGVDLSEEMLDIAHEAEYELQEPSGALYLCQDMCELELFGTVGAAISICDSLNYVLETDKITDVFKKVNNYLFPDGLFLFDFNTVHKYRDVIGNQTIAENREEASFIWENIYHEDTCINEYELSIFIKDDSEYEDLGEDAEAYVRFTESHFQKGYTLSEIKNCLEEAGLLFLEALDGENFLEADENSERIFVIAKECTKKKL